MRWTSASFLGGLIESVITERQCETAATWPVRLVSRSSQYTSYVFRDWGRMFLTEASTCTFLARSTGSWERNQLSRKLEASEWSATIEKTRSAIAF